MSHAPGPPQGPFRILAFRDGFPRRLQPWVYVFFALCFQLSGGRYLGAMGYMMGEEQLMREDLMMCLHCNLAGMASLFPLLFRMKFRFTNLTLLRAAAIGVLVTNLLIPYTTCLPLLWLLCFIEGYCKLQGTFECMSNIQLWMSPTRNMRVFFPILHLFIMFGVNGSAWIAVQLAFGCDDWRLMHWLVAGLMLVILLIMKLTLRHARFMPKVPLWGIDWVGYVLWNALLLQLAYLFDYGDWMDWYNSPVCCTLTGTLCITVALLIINSRVKIHPFVSRKVFKFSNVNIVLVVVTLFEMLLAAENVLEEALMEGGLHFSEYTASSRHLASLVGAYLGCGFGFWWMKIRNFGFTKLGLVASIALTLYMLQMYFLVAPGVNIEQFWLPAACRGFATALVGIMLMTLLNASMDFPTFFIGLCVFNSIHMMFGGCLGGALYTHLLDWATADAAAHYAPWQTGINVLLIGVRSCYGWALYACVALILAYFVYDSPAHRYHEHRMVPWRRLGMVFRRKRN